MDLSLKQKLIDTINALIAGIINYQQRELSYNAAMAAQTSRADALQFDLTQTQGELREAMAAKPASAKALADKDAELAEKQARIDELTQTAAAAQAKIEVDDKEISELLDKARAAIGTPVPSPAAQRIELADGGHIDLSSDSLLIWTDRNGAVTSMPNVASVFAADSNVYLQALDGTMLVTSETEQKWVVCSPDEYQAARDRVTSTN